MPISGRKPSAHGLVHAIGVRRSTVVDPENHGKSGQLDELPGTLVACNRSGIESLRFPSLKKWQISGHPRSGVRRVQAAFRVERAPAVMPACKCEGVRPLRVLYQVSTARRLDDPRPPARPPAAQPDRRGTSLRSQGRGRQSKSDPSRFEAARQPRTH